MVGDGPELRRLRRLAGPTMKFSGRISDERVAELLPRARALVVTATEEFGIAAVEALAAGRPVIALDEGGVRESVVEGVTGTFFERASPRPWRRRCAASTPGLDPRACRAAAERFGAERFRANSADRRRGGARRARAAARRALAESRIDRLPAAAGSGDRTQRLPKS